MSSDALSLIRSINWYRGVLDLATAAVVLGLIGEYRRYAIRLLRALCRKNWHAAKLTFTVLIFPLLVVGGVAAELWTNVRVSALENEWEIAQLPRELNADKLARIANAIVGYAGTRFDLAVTPNIEPIRLLDQIEKCLLAAHWVEMPPPAAWGQFDRMHGFGGGAPVGEKLMVGVWVVHPPSGDDSLSRAAAALIDALRAQGLAVKDVTDDDPDPSRIIDVWVGEKP